MKDNMIIKGGNKFCCPSCKTKLQINLDVHGDDNEEEFGYVGTEDVHERLWFNGIELDMIPEPEDVNVLEDEE